MDLQELRDKYLPLIKPHLFPIVLGFTGLILIVYGLIWTRGGNAQGNDIVFEEDKAVLGQEASISASVKSREILIDVEGAVQKPGVYHLDQSARFQDGLVAAGGLSEDADRTWIAKNINLATKLIDGSKIYLPKAGEIPINTLTSNSSGVVTNQLVNINSASESELDMLPGVGPVTARKIISNRPYGSLEELLSKKVVSARIFGQIKEKVSVN